MPRYIDADALKQGVGSYSPVKYTYEYGLVITVEDIDSAPTADVVEVVRCKDCIYGIPTRIDTVKMKFSDERYCTRHRMCHLEDYYCADGKPKEGGADGQETEND